jgi:hypothetical protein
VRIRVAKPSDSKAIAALHFASRGKLAKGFFTQVSKLFLVYYYKALLDDPNSVVVCAEESDGVICGFASGTLDAAKQFSNMSRYKIRFALALLPSIVMNPKIILDAFSRYLSIHGKGREKYVSVSGARTEFWVWDASNKKSMWAGVLNNSHLHLLFILGVKSVHFEVDSDNDTVVRYSERNGAILVDQIELKDGRTRLIMQYDLVKKFARKSSKN